MKKDRKNRSLQERRTEIEERIIEVEADLAITKSDILDNILPTKLLKSVAKNATPMPVKTGAQLLATRIVSNSHPLIRVAAPFVTNSLFEKISKRKNQKIILDKAHDLFSWIASKTKLSLVEEGKLLSAEIEEENLPKKNPFSDSSKLSSEKKNEETTTLDPDKVSLY